MKNTLKKIGLLSLFISAFVACDKDYNNIGTNLLTNSNFNSDSIEYSAVTYNKAVAPVRSSNLSSNLLGVYKDPHYGLTTAHIVTQVVPTSYNVDFGNDPLVESVILSIPYLSTDTGEDETVTYNEDFEYSTSIYEIDSLYGDLPVKLSIYQNDYFLRDYDPETNLEEFQLYYSNSNETINFNNFIGPLIFEYKNDDDVNEFIPDPSEIVIVEQDEESMEYEVTERIKPSLREELPTEFWKNLIIDNEGSSALSNANNFKEFFRGLYFKVEAINNDGNMVMLDFGSASITINYTYISDSVLEDDDDTNDEDRTESTYVLNLTGNSVNVIENNYDTPFTDGDAINGDETIYLKGMEGSMGIIKLFGGTDGADQFKLDFEDRLINEANLIVYVDQDAIINGEPDRLMLYDIKNKIPLVDYYNDVTASTSNPLYSRILYSEILEREEEADADGYKKGIKYKFRLTEHLNNILLRDSTNLDLGLVVSANVNSIAPLTLEGADENSDVEIIPIGSFLSPRGTILHGSNANVAEDKRIKLEIFYSEFED